MRLLLDTHIFLWACDAPNKLSAATRQAIADETNYVAVSAATAWEIAIKVGGGRLRFPVQFWSERIATLGVETIPILPAHALEAGALPELHKDPFDRMLIAQARLEGLMIVTQDRLIRQYDIALFAAR